MTTAPTYTITAYYQAGAKNLRGVALPERHEESTTSEHTAWLRYGAFLVHPQTTHVELAREGCVLARHPNTERPANA